MRFHPLLGERAARKGGVRGRGAMRKALTRARVLRREATEAEKLAWWLLRNRMSGGVKFRRQHPIGKYVVDFFCFQDKFAIELDGSAHSEPSQAQFDRVKDAYLAKRGVRVLRLANGWVLENPEGFLERIRAAAPHPSRSAGHPLPKERVERFGTASESV